MKIRKILSAFLSALMTVSCLSVLMVNAADALSIDAVQLHATAALTTEDYANIEKYRVLSGSVTDDFGREIDTYKPLWNYSTVVGGTTVDNSASGVLRANVDVSEIITKANYDTVKLVYRSTCTETPTLTNGTKTVEADTTSIAANAWNTLYYDYTELVAADSFIINFTEGTNPNDYKDDTWEIGYLGLMESATAAQAHISAFEGEFAVADVLLGGESIGNVTAYEKALGGALEVPKLTVKATGDTSKVTITNGVIDGEGKATSKVTNDGTDVVVINFTGGDSTFRVTDILVDGKSIGNFDAATKSYEIDLGYGAAQPVVTYTYAGAEKTLVVATIPETDQSKYTVTIADGENVLYTLVFNVDSSLDSRLVNTLYRLKVDKELNVSYFGGSVTNNPYYRPYLEEWFDTTFEDAEINHINSSIGGSGSMFGVHRLKEHVVEYMETKVPSTAKSKKPDLVFIEFAVNDAYGFDPVYKADGTNLVVADSDQNYINIESMIRQLHAVNPKVDIIFVITGDHARLKNELGSENPVFGQAYTDIADYYNIPICYVGRELVLDNFYKNNVSTYPANDAAAGWLEFYNDMVHPKYETGGKHYADTIIEYLEKDLPTTYTPEAEDYVSKTLCEIPYCTEYDKGDLIVDADLVDIEKVDNTYLGGYTVGSAANNGLNYPLLSSNAGDVFSFETNATNVWLWLHAKSAETELIWTIDDGAPRSWKFRMGNPNNYALQLAEGLDNAETHTIRLYHNDANLVEIRSIMLSGMPEGEDATIEVVPYFDFDSEEYAITIGGEEYAEFDPDKHEYTIEIELEDGEGYPEVAFECKENFYGYSIEQANVATGKNTATLTIDNRGVYTFDYTISGAVEIEETVKATEYGASDARAVLKAPAEFPIQIKTETDEWADADEYPAGTTEFTGLSAGIYQYRYVRDNGYGSTVTFRIWNTYPTNNVYYVSDNGAGNGSSPENPAKAEATIDDTLENAATYFGTKAKTEACYIAIVGELSTSATANTTLNMDAFKDLTITGEYGSVFNYIKAILHSEVNASTGKLTWKDLDFIIGNPNGTGDPNGEISYNALGNEVAFENCRTIGYATNVAGQTRTAGITVHYGRDGYTYNVKGNAITINSPEFNFDSIMMTGFYGGAITGNVNYVIDNVKVNTLTIAGRGGATLNGVAKAVINGGSLDNVNVSGIDAGKALVKGTIALVMNGGTVKAVRDYSTVGDPGYTEDTVDKVVIFNNGTSATTLTNNNMDYVINSSVGGSVDITTDTNSRLTGFTFTTNKSYVIIKNGNEPVETLEVTNGTASISTSALPAGEYTVTYGNPEGMATISAKIKLGRAANKTAADGNGLKLEIRNTATNELLKTIELETAQTITDADGYITVDLQTNVSGITAESITLVAVKNGYAPYSVQTTSANLVSALESFFEDVDNNFEEGHGDIKDSFEASCGDGKINMLDFVRVIRGFAYSDNPDYVAAVDLDEDGVITVNDLDIIKSNFGYGEELGN